MSVLNTSARLRRTTGIELSLTGPPSGCIDVASNFRLKIGLCRATEIEEDSGHEVVYEPPDPVPAGKSADWDGWLQPDQEESSTAKVSAHEFLPLRYFFFLSAPFPLPAGFWVPSAAEWRAKQFSH